MLDLWISADSYLIIYLIYPAGSYDKQTKCTKLILGQSFASDSAAWGSS